MFPSASYNGVPSTRKYQIPSMEVQIPFSASGETWCCVASVSESAVSVLVLDGSFSEEVSV